MDPAKLTDDAIDAVVAILRPRLLETFAHGHGKVAVEVHVADHRRVNVKRTQEENFRT